MKFSMMTYTMMRQKCYTPEDCVRVAKELGMDGIDWVTTYDRDARELRKLSDDAGLPVVAHTFFLRQDDMPQLESSAARHLDDAVTLGAPVVMIPPTVHPGINTVEECRKLCLLHCGGAEHQVQGALQSAPSHGSTRHHQGPC